VCGGVSYPRARRDFEPPILLLLLLLLIIIIIIIGLTRWHGGYACVWGVSYPLAHAEMAAVKAVSCTNTTTTSTTTTTTAAAATTNNNNRVTR